MKLEFDMWRRLLYIYTYIHTKFQVDISKHVEKKQRIRREV